MYIDILIIKIFQIEVDNLSKNVDNYERISHTFNEETELKESQNIKFSQNMNVKDEIGGKNKPLDLKEEDIKNDQHFEQVSELDENQRMQFYLNSHIKDEIETKDEPLDFNDEEMENGEDIEQISELDKSQQIQASRSKMSRKRKCIDIEEAEQLLFSSDSECSSDSEFDEGFSNLALRDFDEIYKANDDEPVSLETQSTAHHIDEDKNVSVQPQTIPLQALQQKPPPKKKSKQDSEIFQWIKIGTENGSNRKSEKFTGGNKAKFETLEKTMPEIFYEIFPDSIFELMVKSTNANAKKFLSDKKDTIKKSSRYNAWYDVTIQEMRQFLGLYILMGIIHKPNINSYWATDKYLSTPTFPSVMKRDRFCNILTFLHFEDASETKDFSNGPERRLRKLNSLMHILNEAIGKKYYPSQNLSLDESLLLWKGSFIFRPDIKSKRSRFGIKIFKLVDSNGVTVKTNVYTGKMEEENGFSKTETIVVNMMKDFLEKYHHLYTDNFYTTPKLYRYLKEHKTSATGTVRSNRQGMPKDFRTLKIEKGQRSGYETKDLLALLYGDKRNLGLKKQTRYQCKTCTDHPGLCPDKCFEIYHTKLQY
ncbi:PiggyBac transposable element-derived protein 4 [Armadillidium nasatum]|uniref:PiggyBac transposable element-derived protein 4 n=1 Tax=Armadillidium nasatum TaxID=96803 RepID=A0A5N5TGZ5_9CRUS|nr:PiggyBac transposable element-derived protein 4 [Armadillidium nasatum]